MNALLPDALAAWGPWLSWMQADLVDELGHMVQRLDSFVGPFQTRRDTGQQEPEGLGDLARRGSYDRLLSTEWLMATDFPDEFLRRAANAEHLFLAPTARGEKSDRLIVAIFDAGPSQWGGARLAHLALWVVLARRATAVGGEFRWGLLHQPGVLHDALTVSDLKAMLRARSYCAAGEDELTAWTSFLATEVPGLGESWWVGMPPQPSRSTPDGISHGVVVQRGLRADVLDLDLQSTAFRRSMQLPLPPEEPACRLLTGHFQGEVSPVAHSHHYDLFSLQSDPVVASSGRLVAVRLLDRHGVMEMRIPKAQERKKPKPRLMRWSVGAEVLTAAFAGRSFGALLSREGQLVFWQMAAFAPQALPVKEVFDAPPGQANWLQSVWQREGGYHRLYVLDSQRQLVYWMPDATTKPASTRGPMLMDKNVYALLSINGREVLYATQVDSELWVRPARANGRDEPLLRIPCEGTVEPKVFLVAGNSAQGRQGAMAVCRSDRGVAEVWQVYPFGAVQGAAGPSWEVALPAGARAVGLVGADSPGVFRLVVQSANKCSFFCQSASASESLFTLPIKALRITVCSQSNLIAMLTEDRALRVYSTQDKTLLLSSQHEASPQAERDGS